MNKDLLIVYDITTNRDSAVYTAVKECMIKKGYFDRFTSRWNNHIIYLPNTTLWKQGASKETAFTDLESCVKEYNNKNETRHSIERCIVTDFSDNYIAQTVTTPYSTYSQAPIK
jgi:hypothetical protein